jgi:hypothetical protein
MRAGAPLNGAGVQVMSARTTALIRPAVGFHDFVPISGIGLKPNRRGATRKHPPRSTRSD